MTIKFKLLHDAAKVPARAKPGDAGLDIFLIEEHVIESGQDEWLRTGIAWEPPPFVAGLIRPRSSATKRCLSVTEGTVDSGYRGEIFIHVINYGPDNVTLKPGERIAQIVPMYMVDANIVQVTELGDTDRQAGGFGSTGR